ncbi:CPBP family intramembrane glutamic endopeptidase [Stakelama tenebrarum]|uniref:CPBP family intramembrane metalloprotease n=1 Tax=Stakelama tenebrarum TaxID=2711215 RepID=A0A6G6Y0D3_9SPHN|nr:CPBP family intramembrane glutamic endopeptidase [Sphingosinithalassobacter tenebrarum]QIG78404.1 CPBP family intramembrane metalloprotease [Sphingosinithalassobacter tenebrarum]
MIAVALLVVALIALAWSVNADLDEFRRFQAMEYTHKRQQMYLWWVFKYFLLFVGMGVGGLALLGQLGSLWTLPEEFSPASGVLPAMEGGITWIVAAAVIGAILAGGVIGGVIAARQMPQPGIPRGVDSLLPRNGGESWRTMLLSINAGVGEEIFFRLYLPLLLIAVGLSAVPAFAVAILLFALSHAYQGAVGIAVTAVIGILLALAYLASGSLWLVIGIHIALDLNALVLRPSLARLIQQRGSKT